MNELKKIWSTQVNKLPIIQIEDAIIYLQPSEKGNKIEYGQCYTNTGLIIEGEYEYDFDFSLQQNLEELYSQLYCEYI